MPVVEVTYRIGPHEQATRPRPVDAEVARRRLIAGNRIFAGLSSASKDGAEVKRHIVAIDPLGFGVHSTDGGSMKQRPFAAILGCSDARVPIELIFNEGPNELFVVRIAGNGLGYDALGSLTYAIEHLRDLRLLVVLGHSGCGVLSAAVDAYLDPAGYLPLASNHALRSILDRNIIVVQASARRLRHKFGEQIVDHPRFRDALVETSVVTNAAVSAYSLQQELNGRGLTDLRAVYGVFLLETCEVWVPGGAMNLADPPSDSVSFAAFADAVVASGRIAAFLA